MGSMIFYALLSAAAIGLCLMVRNRPVTCGTQQSSNGCSRREALGKAAYWTAFLLLFAVSALRVDIGNDYGNYVDTFHEIYVGGYVVTEPGFNLFVRTVYMLSGGENYRLVFALFAAATILLFMKAMYEESMSFRLSFAMFLLLGLYFRTFNTVRYYLVLAVTLYSLKYVLKREWGKFLLLTLLAATFHKSVLIVIPLYLVASFTWKKWQLVLGGAFGACLLLFQEFWMKIALELYPSYKDTVYLSQGTGLDGSFAGIIRCLAVLLLGLVCYRETIRENRANLFYFKLNLLGLSVYLCASFLPLVSRIGYYLITPQILLVPGILCGVKDPKKRNGLFVICGAACLFYFGYFLLTAGQTGVRVLPYTTWIFTEKEWINGGYLF